MTTLQFFLIFAMLLANSDYLLTHNQLIIMKKLLLSLILGLSTITMFAQIPVSTSPQNRKAILEEFTGIHCGYCPDGHAIAHDILVANPGNAFMIAIHQGSYANPAAGEPDFRTAFGDALEAQTGLQGYPAGTVNRHNFGHGQISGGQGTAEDRDQWTADAATIMGQPSCLNVGVSAQIDYVTRILTIHCQVYYTGNSTVATNKLNIALLQNNIKAYQSNYGPYNTSMITPDGLYKHQHMLRNLFTGQWGIAINNTNTASGTMKVDTTFTYTVPANFTSVDVCLAQLEVVAFVTEGNQEVISGGGCLVTPAPAADASIIGITGLPAGIQCNTNNITPSVKLKNMGTDTLRNAVINYTIDGGTPVTQNWTGNLATGDSVIVAITNPIVPTNGAHKLRCFTTLPNGITDYNYVNDDYFGSYTIFSTYSAVPVNEDFSLAAFPPANWIVDGSYWLRSTASSFGVGSGSAKMNFFSATAGTINDLYVYGVDLTTGAAHYLSFDHAYAQYSAENDRLQVQVSTNCGTTWNNLFDKAGTALKTAPANTGSAGFTPTAAQWAHHILDLTPYDGQANVMIRFHATSDYGNNLYVDKVVTGLGFGVNESQNNSKIEVYPNPATDFVNIVNAINSNIQLYDVLGNLIATDNVTNNNYSLNVANLAKGTYVLKITNGEGTISKKITVLK